MSPEAHATRATLQSLRDEIAADRRSMAIVWDDLSRVLPAWLQSRDIVASGFIALQLHGYYTAIESLFEHIARDVDGAVPQGPDSHKRLLGQMFASRDGRRPPVIDAVLLDGLRELLGFRHFVRHAYGTRLDFDKLKRAVDVAMQLEARLSNALDAWDAYLSQAIVSATGG